MTANRFETVIRLIDEANAGDPTTVMVGGTPRPAELLYGQRMSARLAVFCQAASEHLRIAARAQHLERWKLPRSVYPMGKSGYFRWRNEQKRRHGARASELMAEAGYDRDDCARVESLVRKEQLKRDREAQALEDVACLVFLEHYMAAFAATKDEADMTGIIAKTWRKMSNAGHAAALALTFPPELAALVDKGVKQAKSS
jgi:hypothetical protein